LASYRKNVRLHVAPYLGATPMDRLTGTAVDAWMRTLEASGRVDGQGGLSPRTVRYVFTTPRPSSAPLPAAPPSTTRSRAAAASTQASDPPDLAFVSPWRDYGGGQWYYRFGLIGFPADTPVEISGHDVHGNVLVAPLVLTTAEGWWNPFTTGFATNFAYGGTCGAAQPATVTARGAGFSVTETVPRPLECEGGTTPNGPWTPAVTPSPSPTMPPPSAGSGGG
jgi:hypothetical protein